MPMPSVFFTYAPSTLKLAQEALDAARLNPETMGPALTVYLESHKIVLTPETTAKDYIAYLMATRQPSSYAESQLGGDNIDWKREPELAILSRVAINFSEVLAYNNGAWHRNGSHVWEKHEDPLKIQIAVVSAALQDAAQGPDYALDAALLKNAEENPEAALKNFVAHYTEKLLHALRAHNDIAKERGERLVVNIPGLGTGQFAGPNAAKTRALLPRALQQIIQEHAAEFTHIHTINYDPFVSTDLEGIERDQDIPCGEGIPPIHFQIRPYLDCDPKKAQLEFPSNITPEEIKSRNLRLLKFVAGDPSAYPLNDLWSIDPARITDEVGLMSSNVLAQLFEAGVLRFTPAPGTSATLTFAYNDDLGYQVPLINGEQVPLSALYRNGNALAFHCPPALQFIPQPPLAPSSQIRPETPAHSTRPAHVPDQVPESQQPRQLSVQFFNQPGEQPKADDMTPPSTPTSGQQ